MIKKILFGSVANLISIIVLTIATLARSALAVRYLSVDEAGFWFLFLNIITFTSFCDFGLSPALSREIGFSSKKKYNSLRISNLFFTVKRIVSYVSLISIVILFCFGYFYIRNLAVDTSILKHIFYAFALCGVGIIIQFQANPYLAVIYGVGSIAAERYIRAIGPVLGIIISMLLITKVQCGLYGLAIGYAVQAISIYILSRCFLYKKINIIKNGRYLKVIFQRILQPSLQWTFMGIGATLIFQTSNFVIAHFMGVKYVTQFSILFQIFSLILTLAGIIGYVITPLVAQAKGLNDNKKINYYFLLSVRSSTAIAIFLSTSLYFFIDDIVRIWLGSGFVINKNALLILLAVAILEANHVSCAIIAMATGYVKFALIALIAGILNLFLSFLFIPYYGVSGAALSIFVSQILTNNWYVVWISLKKLVIPTKDYINILSRLLLFFIYIIIINICINFLVYNIIHTYMKLCLIGLYEILFLSPGIIFLLSTKEKQYIKSKPIWRLKNDKR